MSKYSAHVIQWADDLVAGRASHSQVLEEIQKRYTNVQSAVTVTSHVKQHVIDKIELDREKIVALLSTVPPHAKVQEAIPRMSCREILQMQKLAHFGNYTGNKEVDRMLARLPLVPSWVHELRISRDISEARTKAIEAATSHVLQLGDIEGLFGWLDSIDPATSTPVQCLIACCLYTGRRTSELTLTGRFEPVEGNPFAAMFSGQLKKKTRREEEPVYQIPLLAPFGRVASLICSFRSRMGLPEGVTTSHGDDEIRHKIHQKYQATLNRVMHRELDRFVHEKSCKYKIHDLRAIYAYLSYEIFMPDSITFPGWIHQVLGHETVNVSVCYNRIRHSQHDQIVSIRARFL